MNKNVTLHNTFTSNDANTVDLFYRTTNAIVSNLNRIHRIQSVKQIEEKHIPVISIIFAPHNFVAAIDSNV